MKSFSALLMTLFLGCCFCSKTQAQGTNGNGFLVQVSFGNKVLIFKEGECGFGTSSFGGAVRPEDNLEGEVVFAYTAAGDSFLCEPAVTDLTGKFAFISRGPLPGTPCAFSLKASHAQAAGAKCAVIMNHYGDITQTGCSSLGLGGTAVSPEDTIPAIGVSRDMGEVIRGAILAGEKVMMKFIFPRMSNAAAAYHYATPVSHVDTLKHISVHFANRTSEIIAKANVKCDLIAPPGGTNASFIVPILNVNPGQDVLVNFPAWMHAKVKGLFTAVFSNDIFTEERDTLTRRFVHTDYTWSQANFTNDPQGYGPSNADFIAGDFIYHAGGLCFTGNVSGSKATHVSFGISNIDSVFVQDGFSGENDIIVSVFDGDPNNDGKINFGPTFSDMIDNNQRVAMGIYTMKGDEKDGVLVSSTLKDNNGNPFLTLKPNHPYYVSLYYNGLAAFLFRSVRFMNSLPEYYINFPSVPMYLNNKIQEGFSGGVIMHQLKLEGFDPQNDTDLSVKTENPYLDESKIAIFPNPANDQMQVDLKLNTINKGVVVRLMDMTGRIFDYQKSENFQAGRVIFETQSLPSGNYFIWVSTAEGTAFKQVAICH